jgi:hypothetical protein
MKQKLAILGVCALIGPCFSLIKDVRCEDIHPYDFEITLPSDSTPVGEAAEFTKATAFPALDLLVWKQMTWDPGDELKVCFYGGDLTLVRRISEAVQDWANAANIHLNFGDGHSVPQCTSSRADYQIRVGFSCDGNWSLVGQQSEDATIATPPNCAGHLQTLNLSHVDKTNVPDPVFKGVVLHEFGHALGFKHEHQNPNGPCSSDLKMGLIRLTLLNPPYQWTKDQIQRDFAVDSDLDNANASTEFDPKSIMMYSLPKEWVKEGSPCFVPGRNLVLSALDQIKAREIYGSPGDEKTVLKRRIHDINVFLASTGPSIQTLPGGPEGVIVGQSVRIEAARPASVGDLFTTTGRRIAPVPSTPGPSTAEAALGSPDTEEYYTEFLTQKRIEYEKALAWRW